MQGNNKFIEADDDFEAEHADKSAAGPRWQRAGNLAGHVTGTENERKEEEAKDNLARNCTQRARKPVEQATGEVETIFVGVNGWGNESAPPLAAHTMGITGDAAVMITQQATTFPAGGNAPMAGTTLQNLNKALMGGNPTLHNISLGGNEMEGATGTAAAPLESPAAGQKKCMRRESTGWSALTESVKIFGPATQEISKNY